MKKIFKVKAVIWYTVDPTARSSALRRQVHRPVAVIDVEGDDVFELAEDAFAKMQGEQWSPFGEARPLIQALGLSHTSMSVGDIVEIVFGPPTKDSSGRAALLVAPTGFTQLAKGPKA